MNQNPFYLAGAAAVLLARGTACGETIRLDFGARLEPVSQALTGAGQVDAADVTNYAHALNDDAKPVIFMDYVDVHTPHVEKFFSELDVKLASLGWYAVPQIGLGMDDDQGRPYDHRVAAGDFDENLRQIVAGLKKLDRPVFLRIGYEFHGDWNGYTPTNYIASFRKIVGMRRQAGADKVATIWCAEASALPADYLKYYPGDEYVDWWAIDLFEKDCFDLPNVKAFMAESVRRRKPVMIGESTPRHVGVKDGEKSWNDWFVAYFAFIEGHSNVKAFCYINWDWRVWGKRYSPSWMDWGDARLQENDFVREHFRQQLMKPLYLKSGKTPFVWWTNSPASSRR